MAAIPRNQTDLRERLTRFAARPEVLLAGAFVLLIAIGAMLLSLPISHNERHIRFLDAWFTSTSAVCVTGLIVVDTADDYSRFGQTVIIVLIQLGGLGIMTFAGLATHIIGRRLSFRSQAALFDSIYQTDSAVALRKDVGRIIALTMLIEALGAGLLYEEMRRAGEAEPLFSAAFHSISAFCNAGFSINTDNLMRYQSRPGLLGIIAILIVVGGLGHTVILEVARRFKRRLLRQPVRGVGYSLNTRVVLRTSAALILIGALALLAFGMGDGSRPWGWRIVDALFQSVTARTAGFNSLAMSALPTASSLVIVGLMFIGGSPGSCAGGVKTTSVVAWGAQLRSEISGRHDATILGRRLPADMITRAAVVIGLAAMWTATGCVILSALELPRGDLTFRDIMFEQFSAFGTVGLSTGVTPGLSVGGKLWIIASMFVGRLGPLTAALAVSPKGAGLYRYPEERLMIG